MGALDDRMTEEAEELARIGHGYGSECHLLRFLGRHRRRLDDELLRAIGVGDTLRWLDFPFDPRKSTWQDAEWKGLDFLRGRAALQAEWQRAWPQGRGIMNWDAVGWLEGDGEPELLLVEAKANTEEIRSDCQAKQRGGRPLIQRTLDAVKAQVGAPPGSDWLTGYYQYANRLAVLWFLTENKVPARLVFIYFTGDKGSSGRTCPRSASDWSTALGQQNNHLGLAAQHQLSDRVHSVFLPVAG